VFSCGNSNEIVLLFIQGAKMLDDEEFSADPKPKVSGSKKLPKPHRKPGTGREISPRPIKPLREKEGRTNGSRRN
jgi:hypothetical protein